MVSECSNVIVTDEVGNLYLFDTHRLVPHCIAEDTISGPKNELVIHSDTKTVIQFVMVNTYLSFI